MQRIRFLSRLVAVALFLTATATSFAGDFMLANYGYSLPYTNYFTFTTGSTSFATNNVDFATTHSWQTVGNGTNTYTFIAQLSQDGTNFVGVATNSVTTNAAQTSYVTVIAKAVYSRVSVNGTNANVAVFYLGGHN